MSNHAQLQGKRIAVLAADGFEKVELTIPVKALRTAGAEVDIVSLRDGKIRGVNLHEPASRVKVTKTIEEANPSEYDGLLVPGGFINPDLLRQSAEAREFVRAFDVAGKPIASLCHGPWVLASAGLLKGRTLTSWPGIRDDVVKPAPFGWTRSSSATATSPPAAARRTLSRSSRALRSSCRNGAHPQWEALARRVFAAAR